jgi:hypothetical protein
LLYELVCGFDVAIELIWDSILDSAQGWGSQA